jgi:arylamine N-acetyltransferase
VLRDIDAEKQRKWKVAFTDAALYRFWREHCRRDANFIERGRGSLFNLTVGRVEKFAVDLSVAGIESDLNGFDHDVFRRLWPSNNQFFDAMIRYLFRPEVYLRRAHQVQREIRDGLLPRSRTLDDLVIQAAQLEMTSALTDPLVEIGAIMTAMLPRHATVQACVQEVETCARKSWTGLYRAVLKHHGARLRPGVEEADFTELAAIITEGALLRQRLALPGANAVTARTPFLMALGHIVRGMTYDPTREDPALLPATSDRVFSQYLRYVEFVGTPRRDLESVRRLQNAHLDSFSYSNLDLVLGIDDLTLPSSYLERLMDSGHGALCYQLNASLAQILRAVGLDVSYLWGTVGKERGLPGWPDGNHLGLQVRCQGDDWLVDAGLGDGPRDPLPLRPGTYRQGVYVYEVVDGGDTWILVHDRKGSFGEVVFRKGVISDLAAFSEPARLQATSPRSSFLGTLALLKRTESGARILRGKVFTCIGEDNYSRAILPSMGEWLACLRDQFGIYVGNIPANDLTEIWRRVVEQHARKADEYEAMVRP